MKFQFPKIIEKIEFSEYHEAFGDQFIEVWVNPTLDLLDEFKQYKDEFDHVKNQLKDLAEKESKKKISNFSKNKKVETYKTNLDVVNEKAYAWYSTIWSQGSDPVSPAEVQLLFVEAKKTDPAFINWVCGRTLELINARRTFRKN